MRHHDIKKLVEDSTVKEDLQIVYEAIQELGYTEYTLLKLVERLNDHVEEIRTLAKDRPTMQCPSGAMLADHLFATHEIGSRSKTIEGDVEDIHDRLKEVSDQVDGVVKELKLSLENPDFVQRDMIFKSAPLLVQASKQILQQNGFDPETGFKIQNNEINADYRKLKSRLADFGWSLLFAGIASLIMWGVSNHQKTKQDEQTQLIESATKKLLEAAGKRPN